MTVQSHAVTGINQRGAKCLSLRSKAEIEASNKLTIHSYTTVKLPSNENNQQQENVAPPSVTPLAPLDNLLDTERDLTPYSITWKIEENNHSGSNKSPLLVVPYPNRSPWTSTAGSTTTKIHHWNTTLPEWTEVVPSNTAAKCHRTNWSRWKPPHHYKRGLPNPQLCRPPPSQQLHKLQTPIFKDNYVRNL